MQPLLNRIRIVLVALVVSFAITAIGQGLWGVMAIANARLTPALPWAAVVMPLVLAGLAAFLSGRSWPKWGAGARRALVPLAPVSAGAWLWSLVSGFFGVVMLAALWIVLTSIVRTPPNLLPDMRGVPASTAAAFLLVAIIAAPLTEEIAFRGYAMGLLRRAFGPMAALAISSLMFAAAHLTQGLYAPKLVVYLLVGLFLAAVVWRTGSLLPAMVAHSFGDFAFFTCVWPYDAGRRLISEGGADAAFWAAVATLVVSAAAWFFAFRALMRSTESGPAGETGLAAATI